MGWRKLRLEKAVPKHRRLRRSISVSVVPVGPRMGFWQTCRFPGSMLRALMGLLGGLGRFMPCVVGASRHRRIGWEKSCHGLTSRPWETASETFLSRALRALWIRGNLSLRSAPLPLRASCLHGGCLILPGNVALLIRGGDDDDVVLEAASEEPRVQSNWIGSNREGRKRFRPTRKTNLLPVHPEKVPGHQVPILWKRLRTPQDNQPFPGPKRLCPGTGFSIHASERDV